VGKYDHFRTKPLPSDDAAELVASFRPEQPREVAPAPPRPVGRGRGRMARAGAAPPVQGTCRDCGAPVLRWANPWGHRVTWDPPEVRASYHGKGAVVVLYFDSGHKSRVILNPEGELVGHRAHLCKERR
jgi:hypothetical protein